MTTTEPTPRKRGSMQTKALAGLVAIMLAAAIVALVFVTTGGGSKGGDKAQANGRPSDVGRTSSAPAPSTTAPSSTSAPTTSSAPSTSAAPTTSSSASSPAKTASSSSHGSDDKIVYYTVRKGDTLTGIGMWFKDHGYLTLYQWNKSIIGSNPNLIFPGQRIIVVAHHVGVARSVPNK